MADMTFNTTPGTVAERYPSGMVKPSGPGRTATSMLDRTTPSGARPQLRGGGEKN